MSKTAHALLLHMLLWRAQRQFVLYIYDIGVSLLLTTFVSDLLRKCVYWTCTASSFVLKTVPSAG